jgi:4-hydroxy-3-polyprenylbenzoate decarboxylase
MNNSRNTNTIALAMTGASGMPYGFRLLEYLVKAQKQIYLMISAAAYVVIDIETTLKLPGQTDKLAAYLTEQYKAQPGQIQIFGEKQWTAPIASGSGAVDAMVICPATSGCISAVATGASNNLIERAADVMLKERRQLIVVHRETPLSIIHLENLLKLAQCGATILPANPGFYHYPTEIQHLVDFIVARILDHLNIAHDLIGRWGSE